MSARLPLSNLNRQIQNIDYGLQSLQTEMKRHTQQLKLVVEYAAKMGESKPHQRKRGS